MKILFSPSEAKSPDGLKECINEKSFIFENLYNKRKEAIEKYQDFIKKSDNERLKKFFGIKDEKEIIILKENLFNKKCIEAIQRYQGVAFEKLSYNSLDQNAKNYINDNVLIFSNLFGVLRANDLIPYYKFKQGEKIDGFNIEKFYKDNFSKDLNEYLKDELIIDLRAKFYEKFYTIKQKYISFVFLKNSKILSHFAKAYRGKILRIMAENSITNKEELLKNLPKDLMVKDIKIQGFKEEIVLDILD